VGDERQAAKLIIYRRGKKEIEKPLNVLLNESIQLSTLTNSLEGFDIPISREPVKVCYGNNLNQCIEVIALSTDINYLEGSISEQSNEPSLEQVKVEVGEFYAKKVKFYQEKRERKEKK